MPGVRSQADFPEVIRMVKHRRFNHLRVACPRSQIARVRIVSPLIPDFRCSHRFTAEAGRRLLSLRVLDAEGMNCLSSR